MVVCRGSGPARAHSGPAWIGKDESRESDRSLRPKRSAIDMTPRVHWTRSREPISPGRRGRFEETRPVHGAGSHERIGNGNQRMSASSVAEADPPRNIQKSTSGARPGIRARHPRTTSRHPRTTSRHIRTTSRTPASPSVVSAPPSGISVPLPSFPVPLPSYPHRLPSFPRPVPLYPRPLPSFPRKRESIPVNEPRSSSSEEPCGSSGPFRAARRGTPVAGNSRFPAPPRHRRPGYTGPRTRGRPEARAPER